MFMMKPIPAICGRTLSKQAKIRIGAMAMASRTKSCDSVRT